MGQSSPEALRPYLTYVLNRRIQTSDSAKVTRFATKLRQMTLQEATLVARLREQAELQSAARFIRAGDFGRAADVLQAVVDGLRVRVVA